MCSMGVPLKKLINQPFYSTFQCEEGGCIINSTDVLHGVEVRVKSTPQRFTVNMWPIRGGPGVQYFGEWMNLLNRSIQFDSHLFHILLTCPVGEVSINPGIGVVVKFTLNF